MNNLTFDLGEGYSLVLASPKQAHEIAEVVNSAYGKRFNKYIIEDKEHPRERTSAEKINQLISKKENQLFVLIHDDVVCGTICYVKRPPKKKSGYFGMFSISENLQKKEVSTQMIKAIESLAKSDNRVKMKIDVSGFAKPLHKHYEKWGYNLTGKTIPWKENIHWKLAPEYENHPEKNFVIMKKKLDDEDK